MSRRRLGLLVIAGALLAAAAPSTLQGWWRMLYSAGRVGPRHAEGSVIFVVLDNVRADHTSLCGYGRRTTPTLERLAGEGAHTCRAYAPGTWTLPSHASFFTGRTMLEHGAHDVPVAGEALQGATFAAGTGIPMRALDERLPTLAETMAARGYQTAIVSSNPVVGTGSGLLRGFARGTVAPALGVLVDDAAVAAVADVLRDEIDPLGGPLFLFVNLTEAHEPWTAIPEGVGWAPPRPRLSYMGQGPEEDWERFFAGAMSEEERSSFVAHLTDVYDYGVFRADRSLGAILERVREAGWCEASCRVVVTSDHGEFLGEHGLIDHGFYPGEPNARVPLVVTGGPTGPLPEPFAGVGVHDLVATGSVVAGADIPTEAAFGHANRAALTGGRFFTERMAAAWVGAEKWVWQGGRLERFDLSADPDERSPLPVGEEPPAFAALRRRVEGFEAVNEPNDLLKAQLEAAGYLDPAPAAP